MLRRGVVLCFVFSFLAACKVQIDVPHNGSVITASGSYECGANQSCEVEILDAMFKEEFIAVPAAGYEFAGWLAQRRGICQGKQANCVISTIGLDSNEALINAIRSDIVVYLTPVFRRPLNLELAPQSVLIADGFSFDAPADETYGTRLLNHVSVVDVNADGLDDLLLGGPLFGTDSLEVDVVEPQIPLVNQGNFVLEFGDPLLIEGQDDEENLVHLPRYTELADVNGDGILDMVLGSHGYDGPPFPNENNVLIVSKPGGGYAATVPQSFDYLGFTHGTATGDVDLDRDQDIIFSDLGGSEGDFVDHKPIRVLKNNGDSTFTTDIDILPSAENTWWREDQFFYEVWRIVELVDLNNDGYPDLVAVGGDFDGDGVSTDGIFWNDRTGKFTTGQPLPLPEGEWAGYDGAKDVKGLDINRDGHTDLIIARDTRFDSVDPPPTKRYMQLLLQNPQTGEFEDASSRFFPPQEPTKTQLFYFDLVDLNDDGLMDITGRYISADGGLFIWIQQPSGKFLPVEGRVTVEGRTYEYQELGSAIPIDADNDGDLDILVAMVLKPYWFILENL